MGGKLLFCVDLTLLSLNLNHFTEFGASTVAPSSVAY